MISMTLKNPLYLFADDSTVCHDISHPFDRQIVTSSLSSDLNKITNWSNTWNMSYNPEKFHILTLSLRKDNSANPPIYFLNNRLKEIQSLKLLGLTLSHDLSWASYISKLASKQDADYKAFICSSMEYCSPFWVGSPSSHLAELESVEIEAFNVIGISRYEADSMDLSLRHHCQVGGLCFLLPHFWTCTLYNLCALSPPGIYRTHTVHQQPPASETV